MGTEFVPGRRSDLLHALVTLSPGNMQRIGCCGTAQHIAPGVSRLPELGVVRHQSEAHPHHREQEPGLADPGRYVDHEAARRDRGPAREVGPGLLDDLRLACIGHRERSVVLPLHATACPLRVPVESGAPVVAAAGRTGEWRRGLARERTARARPGWTLQSRTRLPPRLARRPVAGHGTALEGATEGIGRRPSALRILLETPGHCQVEVLGHLGSQRLDRLGHLADLLHQDARYRWCIKRKLARQHLIADDAQTVEVAPAVDFFFPRGLLRAHVLGCADRHAGAGQRATRPGHRFGDAEIGDHDSTPSAFEEDVVRLDVAVNDRHGMGCAQGIRRFFHDAAGFFHRKPAPAFEPGAQ